MRGAPVCQAFHSHVWRDDVLPYMLSGRSVLEAMQHAADQGINNPTPWMLTVLSAAKDAGGDSRGPLSRR